MISCFPWAGKLFQRRGLLFKGKLFLMEQIRLKSWFHEESFGGGGGGGAGGGN